MKYVKVLASLMLMFIVCTAFTSNDKGKGMYIVGVSASFTDSLVYFTDIQFVDSVELGKNDLLPMRDQYSDQLDIYLEHKLESIISQHVRDIVQAPCQEGRLHALSPACQWRRQYGRTLRLYPSRSAGRCTPARCGA